MATIERVVSAWLLNTQSRQGRVRWSAALSQLLLEWHFLIELPPLAYCRKQDLVCIHTTCRERVALSSSRLNSGRIPSLLAKLCKHWRVSWPPRGNLAKARTQSLKNLHAC